MPPGERFGNYLLDELLARGGMAEVYRAQRIGVAGFAREVCVKRILPHVATDPGFVAMFIDEARTSSLLAHPNIVRVEDFGEVDGQYFLVMEQVQGTDLRR